MLKHPHCGHSRVRIRNGAALSYDRVKRPAAGAAGGPRRRRRNFGGFRRLQTRFSHIVHTTRDHRSPTQLACAHTCSPAAVCLLLARCSFGTARGTCTAHASTGDMRHASVHNSEQTTACTQNPATGHSCFFSCPAPSPLPVAPAPAPASGTTL